MKTVLIFLDSLNRHYMSLYGGAQVHTPNIDRLASSGVVFDNHYAGSLPCMPARRELMTGRINFTETPWSGMQPFDESLPRLLNEHGVYTHLITDHYHYFEQRAHGYHTDFKSWEFMRGQEGDPWIPRVRDPEVPEYRGKNRRQDWVNREAMDLQRDEDYPTPQCFMRGIEFLKANAAEDDWFLQLEVFDPHEPFLCPSKYRERFAPPWNGPFHFDWPPYAPVSQEEREAIDHIRACYAGTLAMADTWLGKFLDQVDELGLVDDLRIILTTDHGHLLGEHGYWAKNYMHDYPELVHLPLVVRDPGAASGAAALPAGASQPRVAALTATIDIMPTILSWHGVDIPDSVQGRPWQHLLAAPAAGGEEHHETVLFGYWGKTINITDGKQQYTRVPDPQKPLYDYTAMPVRYMGADADALRDAELGDFLPTAKGVPVYRVQFPGSDGGEHVPHEDVLVDLSVEEPTAHPIRDPALHAEWEGRLREAMRRHEVPETEFERFRLA
ncbi:MAG: sulfatase [Spirochaetota bacterium]